MTKKHYKALAAELCHARKRMHEEGMPAELVEKVLDILLPVLCNALRDENPRFDPDRFYSAVYPQPAQLRPRRRR